MLCSCIAACDNEHRDFRGNAAYAEVASGVRMTDLRPGPEGPVSEVGVYEENRWAVGEGARLYTWFNCTYCHGGGGGGGIGPALRDDHWIYGAQPANIYSTIVQGRPDGMPAFGDRIEPADVWKLVAYVRFMAKLTPKDTWPSRADMMSSANPRRPH